MSTAGWWTVVIHIKVKFSPSYLEPIDSTTIDEGREHSKAVSERISDGTHSENNVEVLANSFNEEVVHCQRWRVQFFALRWNKVGLVWNIFDKYKLVSVKRAFLSANLPTLGSSSIKKPILLLFDHGQSCTDVIGRPVLRQPIGFACVMRTGARPSRAQLSGIAN